jgi:hypothetical protein
MHEEYTQVGSSSISAMQISVSWPHVTAHVASMCSSCPASLIARMQGAHGRLRERVQAYQDEMGKDADRDEPLLDINWQDSEGRTSGAHASRFLRGGGRLDCFPRWG